MKDLETPEQRALERQMLHAAGEAKRRGNDHTHVALGVVLLIAAVVLQLVGYSGVAVLLLLGFVAEMAACVALESNRSMPKVQVPSVSAALEQKNGGKK